MRIMHNFPNRGGNHHIFVNKGNHPVILIYTSSYVLTKSMRPWNSPAGTTSFTSNNSPIMASMHQLRGVKYKLTKWRQCIFWSVRTRRGKFSYSITILQFQYRCIPWCALVPSCRWDILRCALFFIVISSGLSRPCICWFIHKVVFVIINNPIMIIVAVD